MRANYKIPNRVKRRMSEELYMYWDNIEKLKSTEIDIIDSSPEKSEVNIKSKNLISKPTESKAIKIADTMSTRALIMARQNIQYVTRALERLNKEELEVVEIIYKYRYSQVRAETQKNISKDTYYNTRTKIIYLTALEFGEI